MKLYVRLFGSTDLHGFPEPGIWDNTSFSTGSLRL